MKLSLTPLPPHGLTESDVEGLTKALVGAYNGWTPVDLVAEALHGRVHFWRIKGPVDGLVVTRPLAKSLWIETVVCPGIVRYASEFIQLLNIIAKVMGLETIDTMGRPKAIARIYATIGAKPVATIFSRRVS